MADICLGGRCAPWACADDPPELTDSLKGWNSDAGVCGVEAIDPAELGDGEVVSDASSKEVEDGVQARQRK